MGDRRSRVCCGASHDNQRHGHCRDLACGDRRRLRASRQRRQQEADDKCRHEGLHLHQPVEEARVGGRRPDRVQQPVADAEPCEKHTQRKEDAKRFATPRHMGRLCRHAATVPRRRPGPESALRGRQIGPHAVVACCRLFRTRPCAVEGAGDFPCGRRAHRSPLACSTARTASTLPPSARNSA